MATDLTEVDAFTTPITVPEPGDDRLASSVVLPLQALANRTKNVKRLVEEVHTHAHTFDEVQRFTDGIRLDASIKLHGTSEIIYVDADGNPALRERWLALPVTSFAAPVAVISDDTRPTWAYQQAVGALVTVVPGSDDASALTNAAQQEFRLPSGAYLTGVNVGVTMVGSLDFGWGMAVDIGRRAPQIDGSSVFTGYTGTWHAEDGPSRIERLLDFAEADAIGLIGSSATTFYVRVRAKFYGQINSARVRVLDVGPRNF